MKVLDAISTWSGEGVKWVTTVLVVVIFTDVVMRYAFSETSSWVIELEWHLFALIFLIGSAYALKEGQHVRVDLFYVKFNAKQKAWVDLLGTIFFLFPWCLIIIYTSFRYAENSFAFRETSADPGGLPARYIIKFAITIGFSLLFVQGVALCAKCIQTITKPD